MHPAGHRDLLADQLLIDLSAVMVTHEGAAMLRRGPRRPTTAATAALPVRRSGSSSAAALAGGRRHHDAAGDDHLHGRIDAHVELDDLRRGTMR